MLCSNKKHTLWRTVLNRMLFLWLQKRQLESRVEGKEAVISSI